MKRMKKIIALAISIMMILPTLTALVPSAGAVDGSAISSSSDFMDMLPDGTYYLARDISIDSTYETEFTGTLDGNGHTVTVTVPMFKQLNGTVKNLTIVGEVKVELDNQSHIGALAQQAKGPTVDNVTNKANVTVTQTGGNEGCVGGLIGRLNGHGDAPHAAIITNCTNDGDITAPGTVGGIVGCSYDGGSLFENCINNGDINNPAGIKNYFAAGGIYGYNGSAAVIVKNCVNNGEIVSALHAGGIAGDARKSATFENCTNNGEVRLSSTAKSDYAAAAGGMTGFALDTSCTVPLTLTNCVNNADVTAYIPGTADGVAGGMVGYTQKCAVVQVVLKNCLNNGNVTAGNQAGGMVGYVFGSGDTYANIDGCISNGTISAAQYASHFLGYSNQNSTIIVNSIGNGELKALTEADKTPRLAIVCLSGGDIAEYTIENLFLADNGTTELLSWATSDDNAKNRIALTEVLGKDLAGTTITDYEGNTRGLIEASNVKAITRGELNADFIAKANRAVGSELFALDGDRVTFASVNVGADIESADSGAAFRLAHSDFTGDGKIDSADVITMLRHLMNPQKYPWEYAHDFNGDGRETVTDAIHFLKCLLFGTLDSMNYDCTEHTSVAYPEVDATCTTSGYTGGAYCSLCGQTLTERTVVPAKGHNYVDGVCDTCGDIKISTCTGEHNFVNNVCTYCGERGSAGLAYRTYSPTSGAYARVTGIGTCTDTDLIIPKTYNGITVTQIGSSAFANNTAITSVELPDTITNIYANAFNGCSSLTTVKYAGTKEQWNAITLTGTWNNASAINKIVCSDGEIIVPPCEVGEHDFVNNVCTYCGERGSAGLVYTINATYAAVKGIGTCSDTDVIIPQTYMGTPVTDIGSNAFGSNTSITSVEMQEGIRRVYYSAFYGCTALARVSVPDSITKIDDGAFNGCTNMQFNVYDNATYLGNADNKYVLLYDTQTTSMTSCEIHADTKVINNNAFQNCSELVSLTIPDGVVSIGDCAFWRCSQLAEINIPAGVSNIGGRPFMNCSNLAALTVDEDNKYYCAVDNILYNQSMTELIEAAPGIVGVVEIPDSVQTINSYAFYGCSKITLIKIGENSNLKTISSYAFSDCTVLESINIPAGVTDISYSAFRNCTKLTGITVDNSNKYYSTDGVVVFNDNKTSIKLVSGALSGKYVIPDNVTTLAFSAFAYSNVTSVVIHDGVTVIPRYAFSVCYDLQSVYIGKGVTSIERYAFQRCDKLEYIYYSGTEAEWAAIKKDSDWDWSANNYTVICSDTVLNCENAGHDFVNNVCARCGERGSAGLEYSVYSPASSGDEYACVTGIGTCADTGLIIPKTYNGITVTQIGSSSFANNTAITSVELPDTITNIYANAFNGCSSLTTIKYAGNQEQWRTVRLGTDWNSGTAISKIICSDGEITVLPCDINEHNFVNNVCTYCGERGSAGLEYRTYSTTSGKYVLVTGIGTCTDTDLVIPKTYKGITVTQIGSSAFANNTAITSVELPDTITNIYANAFNGCSSLTTIKYAGTKEQWNAITLGSNWGYNSGLSEIICSDGVICYTHDFVDNICTRCGERGSAGLVYSFGGASYAESNQRIYSGVNVSGWGTCTDTEVIIPKTYHGQPVVAVSIYDNNTSITSIELQDGMQVIYKLGICSALTDISVPDSVIRVQNVFSNCANLAYTIENNVKYLGNKDNPYLVLVTLIDKSVSSVEINEKTCVIAEGAFRSSSITSVHLPAGVKSIGSAAFSYCKLLSEIHIPDGVERIDQYAFNGCTSLASIEIPASVTELAGGLLGTCTALTEVTVAADNPNYCAKSGMIFTKDMKTLVTVSGALSGEIVVPDSVETLYNGAFYHCNKVTAVRFGDASQLKRICEYAFNNCQSLASINIPAKVESFGAQAIHRCYSLVDITVSDDNPNFSADGMVVFNKDKTSIVLASSALDGKYIIPNTVTSIGNYAFCYSNTTAVVIPDSVVRIGQFAFYNCSNMTTVFMGKGITNISNYAFNSCKNLTYINYAGTEEEWAAIKKVSAWDRNTGDYTVYYSKDIYDGICLTDGHNFADNVCTYCGERGSAGLAYTVGDSGVVTLSGIGKCTDTDVIVPKTYLGKPVTVIGAKAFAKNASIVNVTLQEGIATIDSDAFNGCASLKSVTLPESLTAISNNSFRNCSMLESVMLPANLIKIGTYAFYGCKSLISITIPEQVTSIPDYCFDSCSELKSITLPSKLDKIGSYSFYGCSALREIALPASLTTIGTGKGYSFGNCTSLTSIVIPEGVNTIPAGCFSKCTSLTDVTVPSTVSSVGADAFAGCPLNLNVKDGGGYLGNSEDPYHVLIRVADDSVTEITVAGDVVIANRAFANSVVESIVISDGVTEIPQYAFANAGKLRSLTLPASVVKIGTHAFDGTTSLTEVVISEDNTNFKYADGIIYNSALDTIVVAIGSISGDIVIPASVKTISAYAFYNCNMLTGVSFADGSLLTMIKGNAFNNCRSLVSFELPANIASISATSITKCSSLTEITIDADNKYIAAIGLIIISVDDPTRMISVVNCGNTLTIPDSITTIAARAISSSDKVTAINIGANVTTIESRAFYNLQYVVTINYAGTMEQWQAINLDADWAYTGKKQTRRVVCTDGTLSYRM